MCFEWRNFFYSKIELRIWHRQSCRCVNKLVLRLVLRRVYESKAHPGVKVDAINNLLITKNTSCVCPRLNQTHCFIDLLTMIVFANGFLYRKITTPGISTTKLFQKKNMITKWQLYTPKPNKNKIIFNDIFALLCMSVSKLLVHHSTAHPPLAYNNCYFGRHWNIIGI